MAGQLGADQVRLSGDLLDQIDKIVPPGTNLSSAAPVTNRSR